MSVLGRLSFRRDVSRDARAAFDAGDFSGAARLARMVLAERDDAACRNILGLVWLQSGEAETGRVELARAVSLSPRTPSYRLGLGHALLRCDDFAGAEAEYAAALALDPASSQARRGLADLLVQRGAFSRALELHRRLLNEFPADLDLSRRASLLETNAAEDVPPPVQAGAETHLATAARLQRQGDVAQAIDVLQEALRLRPTWDEAYGRLAKALFLAGREAIAEQTFQVAIQNAEALGRVYIEAYVGLAELWNAMRRHEDSIPLLEKLNGMAPSVDGLVELGLQLGIHGQTNRALAAMNEAKRLAPLSARVCAHLATVHQVAGHSFDALRACDEAIALDPDSVGAHTTRAMVLISQGDLPCGWTDYEWRRKSPYWSKYMPVSNRPSLEDQEVSGKTVLVYAEQGFGDTMMFARYAAQLAAAGARVVIKVDEPLRRLMETALDVEQVVTTAPLPDHDFTIPVMSLPALFGTTVDGIPSAPYLNADPDSTARWTGVLAPLAGLRVGLVWGGQPWFWNAHNRDIPLPSLTPLGDIDGLSLVSLQQGTRIDETANGLDLFRPGALGDFAETAALVAALDIVVTIDSAVAHLAGGLGKPVWLMLPLVAEWRWGMSGETSPWYPTMRIFRQSRPGDWSDVVDRVSDAFYAALGNQT